MTARRSRHRIAVLAGSLLIALLGTAATAGPGPIIIVQTQVQDGKFEPKGGTVKESVLAPRVVLGRLRVRVLDNGDRQLDSYERPDPRRSLLEPGIATRPQGTPVFFSTRVFPSMRWLRVDTTGGETLLNFDLGPTLVAACQTGSIDAASCATFDSDGDGCPDPVDPEPLVPETEPPQITGAVSPKVLWPPNHKLRDVHTRVTATDDCDPSPRIVLDRIISSEPEAGVTSGDTAASGKAPDIVGAAYGTADFDVRLRAERWSESGRTYTLIYRATDLAGNSSRLSLTVIVPGNRSDQ